MRRHSMLYLGPSILVLATLSVGIAGTATSDSRDPSLPGGRIAFGRFSEDLGDFELYTVASDGSDERSLLPGAHECPAWSPDGAMLAITAVSPSGQLVPAIANGDGSDYHELSADPTLNLGCGAWSPDGARLVLEAWDDADPTRAGIYTVRADDGSDLTRLTESRDVPGSYSPDGTRILFMRQDAADDTGETGRLWVMDADGSDARQLIDRTVGLTTSFSPDGRTVLVDGHDGAVFTVAVESGQVTEVPLPADSAAYGAHWSPDGEWIALSVHMGGEPSADLYAVRLDGTGLTQLTDTPDSQEEFADWSS